MITLGERCSLDGDIPLYTFIYLCIPSYTFIYPQMLPYTVIYFHIPHNIQYSEYEDQHKTQTWSYLGPQSVSQGENLTQTFLPCLQRLWHTQREPKYIYFLSFKRFAGGLQRWIILLIDLPSEALVDPCWSPNGVLAKRCPSDP